MMPTRTQLLLSAAVCLILSGQPHAATDASAKVQFDLEAQALTDAVAAWSKQAGVQLVWQMESRTIGARLAPEVTGLLSPDEALSRLLSGTGLTYTFVDPGTVAIYPAAEDKTVTRIQSTRLESSKAQENGAVRPRDGQQFPDAPATNGPNVQIVDEVIVTGTNIAGADPTSRVITLDRRYFEEAGMPSLGDVIRSLPQNFGGGQSPVIFGAGGESGNLTGATKANLRGLGSGATLTLINGRRLATNGFEGGADISSIPVSAVERIEVLTDGASAIYGSDAVAGVVNVILRKDVDAAEAGVRFGTATQGGGTEQQYSVLAGTSWSSGSAWIGSEYRDVEPVMASERSFADAIPDPATILPALHGSSTVVSVTQDIGRSLSLDFQGFYSRRTMNRGLTIANVQARENIENEQYAGTAGLELQIGGQWSVALNGTLAHDYAPVVYVNTPIGGSPSRGSNTYENDAITGDVLLRGPIARWAAGTISAALGGGYRDESFVFNVPSNAALSIDAQRDVRFAFGEVQVPLLGPGNGYSRFARLSLTLAARYENYNDFGSSTNPKVGLQFHLNPEVTLRANWGTSFVAPTFSQFYGIRQVVVVALPMPTPEGLTQAILTGGANVDLDAETSDSTSFSIDYSPAGLPGLTLAATAYRIRYEDRIVTPFLNVTVPLSNPTVYAPFITPNPSVALQNQVIATATPGRFRNLSGQPYVPEDIAFLFRGDYQNIAKRTARGVDLDATFQWNMAGMKADAFFNGAYLDMIDQFTSTSPEVAVDGVVFNPPSLRFRSGINIQSNAWSALLAINFADSWKNNSSRSQRSISSWTTVDAAITFNPTLSGVLDGMRLQLSAQNIFDRDPPYVAPDSTIFDGVAYDSTNASPLGRFVAVQLSKQF
jgi:iron complex outermembrane receptor protein